MCRKGWLLGLVFGLLHGCGGDDTTAPDGGTGAQTLMHDFGTTMLAPGEERDDVCQSWTLDNQTELWVNQVDFRSDGGYHHSNWVYVPDVDYDVPDGVWACGDH